MLAVYDLDGQPVDSLDLKCLLIGTGMRYPARVHEAVADRARLEPPSNPYACNCIILPGEVAVHLTVNDASPFALDLDDDGQVVPVSPWDAADRGVVPAGDELLPAADPRGPAVRGHSPCSRVAGLMAFFYMWPCEYIRTQETCEFCFQVRAEMAGFELPSPSDEEVAEIIGWGIEHAGVREVQLTAGTKFVGRDECQRYVAAAGGD